MIKQVTIVPAILANSKQDFKVQVERINTFTRRVQIDIVDGMFAPNKTLDVTNIWWPKGWETDLHMMVMRPSEHLETIFKLMPSLCIFQAEAQEDLLPIFEALKQHEIKAGVALLPGTYPGAVQRYIEAADHVMVFAGQIGMQGSQADMLQTEKVPLIRAIKTDVEIGWDGGANMSNVRTLAHSDVDVINVGSAISQAPDPAAAFKMLVDEIDKTGVVL